MLHFYFQLFLLGTLRGMVHRVEDGENQKGSTGCIKKTHTLNNLDSSKIGKGLFK